MSGPVDALRVWLRDGALPFWAAAGTDPAGGFFEQIGSDGTVIEMPRRARLVARQIYVFATAERLGWRGPGLSLVRHGLDFLIRHFLREDGTVIASVSASGEVIGADFDLYDHAFVLFGLAAAASLGERSDELTQRAEAICAAMRKGWSHPQRGFEEKRPRSLPLKSNPHMHLLEAALAWSALTDRAPWIELGDEIAALALDRFIAPATGAVHEYFDGDWRPCEQPPLDVVEPGHQFEWAWLLSSWATQRGIDQPQPVAQLVNIAKMRGVSEQRMAVNELNRDLTLRDDRHRLWPQTERLRAVHALGSPDELGSDSGVDQCIVNLLRFLDHPVAGMWWEHLDRDGRPVPEPSRASSLYHIMSAFAELGVRLD